MNFNYVYRFGVTAWRRKTTVLIVAALLLIVTFGLQYNRNDLSVNQINVVKSDEPGRGAKQEGVRFVESNGKGEKPGGTESVARTDAEEPGDVEPSLVREIEHQLGVPYVNLDTKNPYVPKQRLVHFDLKGAPPKISYIKRVLPLLKTMGATGILLEYEDMFPYKGALEGIAAKNAYSESDIADLLASAGELRLEVIPLVQTFGHVEFALKHVKFSHLREVPGSPQALCPSRNMTVDFIREMVDQVMALHPKVRYLHIGCDEVFQMGQCELCRLELYENLFLRHVKRIAQSVHAKHPELRLIIWDDMLRHVSQQSLLDAGLGTMVEPMVWVYAEDIYR